MHAPRANFYFFTSKICFFKLNNTFFFNDRLAALLRSLAFVIFYKILFFGQNTVFSLSEYCFWFLKVGISAQSCVMNDSLSFILSSFSKWGQLCFCQHSYFWNKFQLLQACLRGKSGTFWKWHCLRIIALKSKRLIHTLLTCCQITWKRIFYPLQQKSMVFNEEFCWNNGSKSLHSFWATPYSPQCMLWRNIGSYIQVFRPLYRVTDSPGTVIISDALNMRGQRSLNFG